MYMTTIQRLEDGYHFTFQLSPLQAGHIKLLQLFPQWVFLIGLKSLKQHMTFLFFALCSYLTRKAGAEKSFSLFCPAAPLPVAHEPVSRN